MILQRIIRFLKDKKGISTSLVEAGAVISIGVALAAAFAPSAVSTSVKGQATKALAEVKTIETMVTSFTSDTGKPPAYYESANVLYSAPQTYTTYTDNALTSVACSASQAVGANTNLSVSSGSTTASGGAVGILSTATCGNMNDYFYDTTSLSSAEPNYENTKVTYGQEIGYDPWGNPYLIYVDAFRATDEGASTYGWIVSAGENRVLETDVDDNALGGDDIGVMMERR